MSSQELRYNLLQVIVLSLTTKEFCMGEKDTPWKLVVFDTCRAPMWIGMRSTAK